MRWQGIVGKNLAVLALWIVFSPLVLGYWNLTIRLFLYGVLPIAPLVMIQCFGVYCLLSLGLLWLVTLAIVSVAMGLFLPGPRE